MRILALIILLFSERALHAQTARINFMTPAVNRPVFTETVEAYAKTLMLFGGNWMAPGIAIGADAPVGTEKTRNYFRLGGEVASYYQASTAILDVSFTARPIYPIPLTEGYGFLNVYVQFSAGPSMYFNTPINWGYHVGVIPGVRYILDQHWGVFAEFGYSFHTVIVKNVPNNNINAGVFAAGVSYEF
jgi:hypothetical protein